MIRKILSLMIILMLVFTASGCLAAEKLYTSNCKEQPLYVVNCEFAPEYITWDDMQKGQPIGYYPAGTPIYNWADSSDWAEIPEDCYLLDWGSDSTCIPAQYLSFEPAEDAENPPVFVDYCEDWVSIRKKPNYSAERLAKLDAGTRIDHWETYNDEFIYVEIDGNFGYVSMRYIRFPYFDYAEETLSIGNCQEWVSLRANPDNESDRLMKVPLDTQIQMYKSFDDDFYLCAVDGLIGYIDNSYLVR